MRGISALVAGRVRRLRLVVARATPGPLLVRLTVWSSALVALALPYPLGKVLDPTGLTALVVVALLPAVWPYTRVVSFVVIGAGFEWLAATTYYGEQVTVWRLVMMAGALYVVHTASALAAVLPYDTVVSPGVLARWLLHAAAVVAVTAFFAVLAVAGSASLGDRTSVVAAVLGVTVVVALGWLLARWARR
jgi:hypothetical protein